MKISVIPYAQVLLLCQSDWPRGWQSGRDFPGHTATATATAATPTLRCKAPGPDKRCSSISTRAAPDTWLMILLYSSSFVSDTTERITHHLGGPSLKVIALSDNYRVRILKLRIFLFHLWVSGLQGNTPVVSTNGVGRPCLLIGSPSIWISCCRGRAKSWCPDYYDQSVPTAWVDSIAFLERTLGSKQRSACCLLAQSPSFSSSASNGSRHRQLRVPELDRWQIWVTGCRCDYVGMTTGVPQIAANGPRGRVRRVGPGHSIACTIAAVDGLSTRLIASVTSV